LAKFIIFLIETKKLKYFDKYPFKSVHCELLGNTPTHRGNIRDELMRDRLRKKLKKRKEQKEKTNGKYNQG